MDGADTAARPPDRGGASSPRAVAALRVVLWTVTLLRFALIPVFLVLAGRAHDVARAGLDPGAAQATVIAVLAAIGFSDVLDGWIARRFGLTTQIGAIVDAAADKLVQVTLVAFFALSRGPAYAPLPIWFLTVLVGRDLVLGGGLVFARSRGVPIRVVHRMHGRITTFVVFVVLAWISFGLSPAGLTALLVPAGAFAALSGALYLRDGIDQARRVLRGGSA